LNLETTLFCIVLAGVALLAVGLVWFVVAALRVRLAWGLGVLLFPPLGLVFALRHRKAAARPLTAIVIGALVASAPIVYSHLVPIDLGPREKTVDGELHITLTGWDRHDYSVLADRPKAVVLQMANPDVTDQTLAHLQGMSDLRELDLNGTQVTDEGLGKLESLTGLESLRLRDTKVTDEGFRRWLAPRESLRQLDLRGTQVTRDTARAWRDARPGRRLLQ
jgi:hypothetical protein